jgi:hypothetical protein
MSQRISGPGVGLPPPQNFYPQVVYNAPQDPSSNVMTLNSGSTFNIPAGNFMLDLSPNMIIQYLDPVNNIWDLPRSGMLGRMFQVFSDGYTSRVANLTGCPVVAVVTNAGSGYPTTGTSVTASGSGGSTWQAVVGGQLSVSTVSVAGSGYGVPPLLLIPPPPYPGVQATGYPTLVGGSVSAVTLNNVGAGYTSAPTAVIVPSPFDPNVVAGNAITQATVVLSTIGSGSVSAVLCTNPGNSVSAAPTLTIAGTGGSSATATAYLMTTMTGVSVAAAGTGYGAGAVLFTVGGIPTATAVVTNPLSESRDFVPRPASALLATPAGGSIASVSTIYDGGLFIGSPYVVIETVGGALITGSATVTATLAGSAGTMRIQPF